MKYDVRIAGNMITGRQGIAYVCKSHEIPVIEVDLDKEQEYDTYKTYGMVNVVWNYRGHDNYKDCRLEVNEGKWKLGSWGCCLSASLDFSDIMEMVTNRNIPTVRPSEIVALAMYSKETKNCFFFLYKVSERININCQTVATLEELTDEEMKEVVARANKWCDR